MTESSNGKSLGILTHSLPSQCAVPRVRRWAKRLAPGSLWPTLWPLFRFLDALRFSLRSLSGHMRTLLAERFWSVELGHPLVFLQNGTVLRNNRTAARSYGIRQLTSLRPWASLDERKAFLAGFDLGEAFASRNLDIPESEFALIGASDFPAWKGDKEMELLNVDARNKSSLTILNPYAGPRELRPQYPLSKPQDQAQPLESFDTLDIDK